MERIHVDVNDAANARKKGRNEGHGDANDSTPPHPLSATQAPSYDALATRWQKVSNTSPNTPWRLSRNSAEREPNDPGLLYRVMRLLASLGVSRQATPSLFELLALGETLRSDPSGSVRNFAVTETVSGHWLPWGRPEETNRTGGSMAHAALGIESTVAGQNVSFVICAGMVLTGQVLPDEQALCFRVSKVGVRP